MSEHYKEHFLNHYNNFINQLKVIFSSDDTIKLLDKLTNISDDEKINKGQLFNSLLIEQNFDLFIKKKLKVFSHKNAETQAISESLFGPELCLKNILNNQPDEVKDIIWNTLFVLSMLAELLNPNKNNNKINKLNNLLGNENRFKKVEEMLGVNVNEATTNMLNDIMGSFEKVLTASDSNGDPLTNIMKISKKISTKYADKITKGDIELDKLMESITKKVPGMDQLISGAFNASKPKEKVVIDENFSTADVNVGLNKDDENKSFNLTNILNMVNKFNTSTNNKDGESGNINFDFIKTIPGMDNIPGIDKMIDLMKKLEKSNSTEDVKLVQDEMDAYLQKELGIDIEKLNLELSNVTKKMEEQNNVS